MPYWLSSDDITQRLMKKIETNFKVWTMPEYTDLTVSAGTYSHHAFEPHFHEHFVIQIVEHGVNEGICNKTKYQVVPNEILILNPGDLHTGSSFQNNLLRYKCICPDSSHLTQILDDLNLHASSSPEFNSLLVRDRKVALNLQAYINNEDNKEPLESSILLIESLGQLFLQHSNIKLEIPPKKQEKNKAQLMTDYIRDNYNRKFTLQELSSHFELSPFYLIKLFSKNYHQTPYQYLRNYRIEIAKEKIKKGDSITQVALKTGFYDQSHFHRNFFRITGLTPFQFSKQYHTRFGGTMI